jgi:AsmA protein
MKYFSIFIVLVLLAVLVFVATFDANNYKPQIIEQVEKATGRDFSIDGDIKLSVFPWVGLKVEDVALGNEKGFSENQFAAIKQLDVKVNVLPLLKKEVQINIIRLHGLKVSLEVAEDKSNNWSGLSQAGQADKATADEQAADVATEESAIDEGQKASPLESLKVEGFEFVDATIRYDDKSSNTLATVSELNLTTSAIEFDEPVKVEFGAHIENSEPAIDTQLELTTQLVFNKDFSEINLSDFVFTVMAKANEFIKQDERIEIKSDIQVLMEEQRITVKQLQISALGTTTVADIIVSQFLETPLIQGGIEVQSFNAREVAKRAGVELPEMAKADTLSQIAIKTKIKLQGEKLQANEFSLKLDDSTLSGWVHVLNLTKQQLRYDLAFDQLNLNDYLPPATPVENAPVATESAANPNSASSSTTVSPSTTGDEKIELPVAMMRKLDVQGDFRIGSLTAKEYDIKQLLMSLKAHKGIIEIKPLSLQMLEGQVSSNVNINEKKTTPAYAFNLDVNQVQVGPAVNPYLDGMMGDKPLTMKGAVNLKTDVKTSGDSVNQLKKNSKGQIVLDMKETEVNGFDPEYFMRKAVADYIDQKGLGLSKTIMGSYKPREVTVFDKIHSTINIANGKARTDDFIMDSKRVKVGAKGYADIMQDKLDVTSSVQLPRGKTGIEKMLDSPLFVRIHGPFNALEYELDKKRLKSSTTDALEAEAKAKVDAEKDRLKKKADAELKRAEKKVKNKLKDALKGLF